jgi:hypothetical protein
MRARSSATATRASASTSAFSVASVRVRREPATTPPMSGATNMKRFHQAADQGSEFAPQACGSLTSWTTRQTTATPRPGTSWRREP